MRIQWKHWIWLVGSLFILGHPTHADPKSAAPTKTLEIKKRIAWNPKPATAGIPHKIRSLSVHHTATTSGPSTDTPQRLRNIQRFHQNKGWPDIAYHFLIDQEGTVWELRDLQHRGDTSTSYDPSGHFLPVLEGNFEETQPPQAQLDALVLLLAWASRHFEVSLDTLKGHRDLAATLCPGEHLYPWIQSGRLAERIRSAGHVEIQKVD